MADYFCLFSLMIDAPITDEERTWLTTALEEPEDASSDDERAWVEDGFIGFAHQFGDDGLWLYSDDTGDTGQVALLLEAFLTRFRPTATIGFQWADTCSKPRLDAYGGGASVVYGDGRPTEWVSTDQWLAERTPIEPTEPIRKENL